MRNGQITHVHAVGRDRLRVRCIEHVEAVGAVVVRVEIHEACDRQDGHSRSVLEPAPRLPAHRTKQSQVKTAVELRWTAEATKPQLYRSRKRLHGDLRPRRGERRLPEPEQTTVRFCQEMTEGRVICAAY